MKRLFLAAGAFVLVLAACGASHKSARTVTDSTPQPKAAAGTGPAIRSIAAQRKRTAGRRAERLLHRVVLPAGARPMPEAAGSSVVTTANVGTDIYTPYVYRHAFWHDRAPVASVEAFFERHPTLSFSSAGVGSAGGTVSLDFYSQPVGGRVGQGAITVTLAPFQGSTVIRVDAGAAWTYPRSPHEVVPTAVREIDIRSLHLQPALRRLGARRVSRHLTDPSKVARIVDWFDALNVAQPVALPSCLVKPSVPVRFVFRSASGANLASAIVPSTPASSCDQIQFTLHGQRQKPLIDSTPEHGTAFIDRVQRLLHVRFGPGHRF